MNRLYSFLITLIIFSTFFEVVTPTQNREPKKITQKQKEPSLAEMLVEEQLVRECRDSIKGFDDEAEEKKSQCRKKKKIEIETEKEHLLSFSSIAVVKAFKTTNLFVMMIYITLFITLWIQFLLLFNSQKSLSNKEQTLLEWNINVPPILGVVGTIYSFARFTLTATEQKGLFEMFKSNFYDAATTTIIGGSFYVINFALAIWIFSKLDLKE